MNYLILLLIVLVAVSTGHIHNGQPYVDRETLRKAKDREFDYFLDNYKNYNDRFYTQTLMDMIRDLPPEAIPVLESGLKPLFDKVHDGERFLKLLIQIVSGVTPAEDEDPGLPPWLPELPEISSVECRNCLILALVLDTVVDADAITWEVMRDPVVAICEALAPFVSPGVRAEVLCPGTIDSQGPVVFNMLELVAPTRLPVPGFPIRVPPFGRLTDICEFANLCLPDREADDPGLGGRLPEPMVGKKSNNRPNLDNAIKIAAFSDMHVEPDYKKGTETDCRLPVCCLDTWGEGNAGRFGDYACNIPPKTIDLFMDKVKQMEPDYAIYGGDSPPHTIWLETEESQFNCTRKVVSAFREGLEGVRVLPNIGNHEMYPTNIYFMDRGETQRANEMFIEEWGQVAEFTPDDIATMRTSAYYSTRIAPGLIAISWNSNYAYTWNWYNVISDAQSGMFGNTNYIRDMEDFVEEKLAEARNAGDKVLFLGHHPSGGDDSIVRNSRWLNRQMAEYKDIIVLHLVGHYHSGGFRMFRDPTTGGPTGIQHSIPALSTDSYRNPSFRMFYLDRDTFELLDFDQYTLDINRIIDGHEPEIEHIFRATEEYGLEDMSVQSWWNLLGRMREDYALFMTWYYNTQSRTIRGHSCPRDSCWITFLCWSATTNYDDYRDCLEEYMPVPPTTTEPPSPEPTPAGAGSITSSILVLLATTLLLRIV